MNYLSLRVELKGSSALTFVAPSDKFCIGSSAGHADLVLIDALIEPCHARIFNLLNTWWIEPVNPTTVILGPKRRRIREASPLKPEEPIRIGPFTIKPSLEVLVEDAYGPDGDFLATNEAIGMQPTRLPEASRLQVLLDIHKASHNMQGKHLLQAFVRTTRALFPTASSCCLLRCTEGEVLPISSNSDSTAEFSLTLTLRCIRGRQAFLWERHLASEVSRKINSLQTVTSAIYCPIATRVQVEGVLVINCGSARLCFAESDLDLAIELSRVIASRFHTFDPHTLRIPTIFLSYANADKEDARRVASFLRREAIGVWMDERLPIGGDRRKDIEQAIQICGVFLVLLSPSSFSSKMVQWETGIADQAGKPILPLLLAGSQVIPPSLAKRQYIRLEGADPGPLHSLSQRIFKITEATDNA